MEFNFDQVISTESFTNTSDYGVEKEPSTYGAESSSSVKSKEAKKAMKFGDPKTVITWFIKNSPKPLSKKSAENFKKLVAKYNTDKRKSTILTISGYQVASVANTGTDNLEGVIVNFKENAKFISISTISKLYSHNMKATESIDSLPVEIDTMIDNIFNQ